MITGQLEYFFTILRLEFHDLHDSKSPIRSLVSQKSKWYNKNRGQVKHYKYLEAQLFRLIGCLSRKMSFWAGKRNPPRPAAPLCCDAELVELFSIAGLIYLLSIKQKEERNDSKIKNWHSQRAKVRQLPSSISDVPNFILTWPVKRFCPEVWAKNDL